MLALIVNVLVISGAVLGLAEENCKSGSTSSGGRKSGTALLSVRSALQRIKIGAEQTQEGEETAEDQQALAGKYKIEAVAPDGTRGALAVWGLHEGTQEHRPVKWYNGGYADCLSPDCDFYLASAIDGKYKIQVEDAEGNRSDLGIKRVENGQALEWQKGGYTSAKNSTSDFYITSVGNGKYKIEAMSPTGSRGALRVLALHIGGNSSRAVQWYHGGYAKCMKPDCDFFITRPQTLVSPKESAPTASPDENAANKSAGDMQAQEDEDEADNQEGEGEGEGQEQEQDEEEDDKEENATSPSTSLSPTVQASNKTVKPPVAAHNNTNDTVNGNDNEHNNDNDDENDNEADNGNGNGNVNGNENNNDNDDENDNEADHGNDNDNDNHNPTGNTSAPLASKQKFVQLRTNGATCESQGFQAIANVMDCAAAIAEVNAANGNTSGDDVMVVDHGCRPSGCYSDCYNVDTKVYSCGRLNKNLTTDSIGVQVKNDRYVYCSKTGTTTSTPGCLAPHCLECDSHNRCMKCGDDRYMSTFGDCVLGCPPGEYAVGESRVCIRCDGEVVHNLDGAKCIPCPSGHISRPGHNKCQNVQKTCTHDQCESCAGCLDRATPSVRECVLRQGQDSNCVNFDALWCHEFWGRLVDCEGYSIGCFFKLMCHNPCICPEWKKMRCGGNQTGDPSQCNMASLLELPGSKASSAELLAIGESSSSLEESLSGKRTCR